MPTTNAARELRVMTFNLRVRTLLDGPNIWDRRRDSVVERVRAFDPDLLRHAGTPRLHGDVSASATRRLHLPRCWAQRRKTARRNERRVFKTARFELLDEGNFWLSTTPDKPGSRAWRAVFLRMVTSVKLHPRHAGATFCWFNTHFEAFSGRARRESAKLLRDRMAHLAAGIPCIVTGEFNASPSSAPYRTLLAEQQPPSAALHDVFRAAHPIGTRKDGTAHFFTGWRGGRRMDWILASAHFQTIAAEVDHTRGPRGYPSDHYPVTAILRIPASAARR